MFDNDIAKAGCCWKAKMHMEAMRIGAIRTAFLDVDGWPFRTNGCNESS